MVYRIDVTGALFVTAPDPVRAVDHAREIVGAYLEQTRFDVRYSFDEELFKADGLHGDEVPPRDLKPARRRTR